MWPTETSGAAQPTAWSQLDRAGRRRVLAGIAILALGVCAAAAVSVVLGASEARPVYTGGAAGTATLWSGEAGGFTPSPVGSAGPRSNHVELAYDVAGGQLVAWDHGCTRLVMGFTGGCAESVDQTWTWDGVRWTAHSPRSSPAATPQGAVLYDAALARVVYVDESGQVWTWTGVDWRRSVAAADLPRLPAELSLGDSMFAAGYDGSRGELVLALARSTWTWDGRRWAEVPGGIPDGESRPDAPLVFDGAADRLVYAGAGHTWTWDGIRWSPHPAPAFGPASLAYDPATRLLVAVAADSSACDRTSCPTSIWTWDGTAWTRAPGRAPALPLSRSAAHPPSLVFDPASGALLLLVTAA